jgi:hypothetical protein
MEIEHVVIIKFNTKQEGVDFMSGRDNKFSFGYLIDGDIVVSDFNGNDLSTPSNVDYFNLDEIFLKISSTLKANILLGILFIDNDNFLKYLK